MDENEEFWRKQLSSITESDEEYGKLTKIVITSFIFHGRTKELIVRTKHRYYDLGEMSLSSAEEKAGT